MGINDFNSSIMTDTEILALVADVVEKSKEEQAAFFGTKKREVPIPEYYPSYVTAVENMEAIRIHAEKGVFPDKLFKVKSPNQTDKEFEYIKANYKQTSLPMFTDYLSTESRAWHDNNWGIKYGKEVYEQPELSFQSYVEKGIKVYGSIENFMKAIVPTQKAIDAMGVVAIKPKTIPTIDVYGEPKVDDSVLLEPIPFYYSCRQVVKYSDGEYYLIELNEKSIVYEGNTKRQVGRQFEFYDKNEIWLIKQVGKRTENTFEATLFFQHDWDKIPVHRLMGIPKIKDGEILYQSPYLFATDLLDLVVTNGNWLQASMNNCVYPYKVMIGDPCEFTDSHGNKCNDGEIIDLETNKTHTCQMCNGSGLKSRMSPLGVLLLKPQTREKDTELNISQKPLEYISPQVDTLEFLMKKIADDESRARKILHLKDSNGQVNFDKETGTATGSDNNLKALYAFVRNISDQTFQIYEFILNAIGYMRYGSDFQSPTLIYPKTFDFKTENDYLAEIDFSNKVGLSPLAAYLILLKYLQNVFAEKDQANILNLIVSSDRLLPLSNDDIALKVGRQTVEKWEEVLHSSPIFFVQELVQENPKFFELDLEKQKELLIAKAKQKVIDMKPEIVPEFADIVGGGGN